MPFEIHFRVTKTSDDKFQVDCNHEPNRGGLDSSWGHFGTFTSLEEATSEAGAEIAYQFDRQANNND